MLPTSRTPGAVYPLPHFDVSACDVEGFFDELHAFHEAFRPCFERSEPRDHFFRYMVGQFSSLERKSIEPIALQGGASSVRAMQRGISDVAWDEAQMLKTYHRFVAADMGEPDGVLIVDETGFPKKGKASVGVARQYCGSLGKVENCQVGVFAAYASRQGYALVDKRLFLPEQWFADTYTTGRTQCAVPKDLGFQTKPQLAAAMIQAVHAAGILPFRYIAADCLYGNSPEFWAACEACVGTVAFVAIPEDTRCWLQPCATQRRPYKYRGETRTKRVAMAPDVPARAVAQLARELEAPCWYRRTVSEGTKGPIVYEFARKRVQLCKDGQPAQTVWLVLKRTLGEEPTYWYYISNAPWSASFRLLVWLSGVRWAVEQCFAETKTELGMDHYELRKYPGWQHHMLTCMLAHFFLWHLKIRLGEKSASIDGSPGTAPAGGNPTPETLYAGRGLTLGQADTRAESYGLSCPSQTA
jgi:SRSO17 transposase